MKSVSKRYVNYLGLDEISQLQKIALFEALRTFDESKNTKFETHLYNITKYTILSSLYNEIKQTRKLSYTSEIKKGIDHNDSRLFEMLYNLNHTDQQLIRNRFVDNMTLKELAAEHNVSIEAMRKRVNKVIRKLKHV